MKKKRYYELMEFIRRNDGEIYFESIGELDKEVVKVNLDSESAGINNAIGIIRYLLKNDEFIKGKYRLVKMKKNSEKVKSGGEK